MYEANFAKAENAAYELLIKLGEGTLPVQVAPAIKEFCHARVMTYSEAVTTLGMDEKEFFDVAASDAAFMIKRKAENGDEFLLLTSDKCSAARERFSMAHELGHMALSHKTDDAICEAEANAFASAFLCPRPVLRALRLSRAKDIASAFGLSLAASNIALENMHKPDRADMDVCRRVARLFQTDKRKRAEDYISPCALADYYASRLSFGKKHSVIRPVKSLESFARMSVDEMIMRMESRAERLAT